jgi:hypothetical protein
MYALATRMMKGTPGIGKVQKNARRLKMVNKVWQNGNPAPASYSKAWENLKSLRQQLGIQ